MVIVCSNSLIDNIFKFSRLKNINNSILVILYTHIKNINLGHIIKEYQLIK